MLLIILVLILILLMKLVINFRILIFNVENDDPPIFEHLLIDSRTVRKGVWRIASHLGSDRIISIIIRILIIPIVIVFVSIVEMGVLRRIARLHSQRWLA